MGIITKSPKITEKIMKIIKGAKGSPFKNVDDLGFMPNYRNPKDLPGTEVKKLKMIGEKIKKNKKDTKVFDQSNKVRGGLKFGGRTGYKSAGSVCKLATKGKGNAYGKNS
mgnify:CR=1 FL=1|jgi:regulatory protein YycH of two-component signal transduction system YycFG